MDKKQALIDAATALAQKHGFAKTTLAMVADESKVPLGNVYYYFRTKQALAKAVAERRGADLDELLQKCERESDPRRQLAVLFGAMRSSSAEIAKHGCPFGRISQDLAQQGTSAKALPLRRMTSWSEERLRALGMSAAESRDAALHLVAGLQGGALIAWVHHDPTLLRREIRTLEHWIATL